MRRLLLLALLCALAPLGVYGQTAISGNLKDAGVVNVTAQNTYVRFTLTNFGGNIPRVTTTNVIAVPYRDFKPDANGNISGTVEDNLTITPAGTFYQVCIFYQGVQFRCGTYLITGPTFNLNSATPLSTIPTAGPNQIITQAFSCPQLTASTTWTCTHNFNDTNVQVQTYDSAGKLINPDTVVDTSPNVVTITFVTAQAGLAVVFHAGSVAIATNQPNAVLQNPTGAQSISGPSLTILSPFNVNATTIFGAVSSHTFSSPQFGTFSAPTPYEFSDTSADSTDSAAQGDSHFLPYLSVNLQANGAGEAIPAYFSVDNRSGTHDHTLNTGRNPAGLFSNCSIGFGARTAGCWGYNNTTSLQTGYPITSISQTGGTTTAVLSIPAGFVSPLGLQAGDVILVQGVGITGYNGIFTISTVNTGTNTITYAQAGSLGSSSGGTVTLDAQLFGFEANYFNSIGDSGIAVPLATRSKWGVSSTNSGTYPIHASFISTFSQGTNSGSPTNGNRPHIAYFAEDAIDAVFRAGDNSGSATVPGGPLIAAHGFYASSRQVATGANNFGGLDLCSEVSTWNGASPGAHTSCIQGLPGTGANPVFRLAFMFDGGEAASIDSASKFNGNISFTGNIVHNGAENFVGTLTTASPVINGASTGTGIQGTDSKLLSSGVVSGTGALLCTDANGGATTSSCSSQSTLTDGSIAGNVTINNTATNVKAISVTFPSSGCPCRAFLSYSLYLDFTGVTNQANIDFWVDDGGGHVMAGVETGQSNATTGGRTSATYGGLSNVTYANGANVTFTLKGIQPGTAGATVQAAPHNGSGPNSDFQVTVMPNVN